jgi:CHAD domain-containing protein
MNAEFLLKYFQEHFMSAIAELNAYGEKGNPERLHQFRVNIKKIRSVIKFLRTIEPGKKLKEINRSIRTIFWKAGEVRELQLKLARLRKSRKYLLIRFCNIESELEHESTAFKDNIPAYVDELNEQLKDVNEEAERISQEQVNRYFGKILLDLKSQFYTALEPSKWHDIRKKSKQVLYGVHWLDDLKRFRLSRSAMFRLLDGLQETIGNWHDEILLKEWLGEKQAFLSEDKRVVRQFDTVWNKLATDLNTNAKKIEQQFSRIHRMKFVAMG